MVNIGFFGAIRYLCTFDNRSLNENTHRIIRDNRPRPQRQDVESGLRLVYAGYDRHKHRAADVRRRQASVQSYGDDNRRGVYRRLSCEVVYVAGAARPWVEIVFDVSVYAYGHSRHAVDTPGYESAVVIVQAVAADAAVEGVGVAAYVPLFRQSNDVSAGAAQGAPCADVGIDACLVLYFRHGARDVQCRAAYQSRDRRGDIRIVFRRALLGDGNAHDGRVWRSVSCDADRPHSVDAILAVRRCDHRIALGCHHGQLYGRAARLEEVL